MSTDPNIRPPVTSPKALELADPAPSDPIFLLQAMLYDKYYPEVDTEMDGSADQEEGISPLGMWFLDISSHSTEKDCNFPVGFHPGQGFSGVLAKSLARIHHANLVNFGLLPMVFVSPDDLDAIEQGDELAIDDVLEGVDRGRLTVQNRTKGTTIEVTLELTERQKEILKAGGLLSYTRARGSDGPPD